jgi:hypothetical protein
MIREYRVRPRGSLALIVSVVITLLLVVLLILPIQVAQAKLPPRPTPKEESGFDASGAPIELRVRFSQVEQARRWQELWTVVQWQDTSGNWHDVEGWKGTLDEMVNGEGRKVWWVFRADLGKGPFRWAVYRRPSGGLLAQTEVFSLPSADGQAVWITVTLKP